MLPLRAEASDAWPFTYAEPADCVRILKVLPYGYTADDNETELFETGIADERSLIEALRQAADLAPKRAA